MRNSMRWPLISLVGQAPVCQALEKFRGNLCHLDARERSFCTPRMYICLLRAILPWYPCLHSRLNFMYNWLGFYIYIAEEHLQYRIVRILCNHWGMFENTTLQTWCVLYTSLKISFSCSVWVKRVGALQWSSQALKHLPTGKDKEPLRDLSRNRNAAIL